MLSLPLFALASVHFVLAGTDAGNRVAILGVALTASAVAGLLVLRTSRGRSRRPHLPGPGGPAAPATGRATSRVVVTEPVWARDRAGAVGR